MSANLLAEFNSYYSQADDSNQWNQNGSHGVIQDKPNEHAEGLQPEQRSEFESNPWDGDATSPWLQNQSQTLQSDQHASVEVDPEDDWGDFEIGQQPDAPETQVPVQGVNIGNLSAQAPHPRDDDQYQLRKTAERPPRDENVLFDVDDEFDDDFGDFETAEPSSEPSAREKLNVASADNAGMLIDFDADVEERGHFSARQGLPQATTIPKPPVDAFGDIEEFEFERKENNSMLKLQNTNNGDDILPPLQQEHWQTTALDLDGFSNWGADDNDMAQVGISNQPDLPSKSDLQQFKSESATDWHNEPENPWGSEAADLGPRPAEDDTWDNFEGEDVQDKSIPSRHDEELKSQPEEFSNTATEFTTGSMMLQLPSILESSSERTSPAPPTNVPPPALLLPLFPPIFAQVQSSLYEPIGNLTDDSTTRNEMLSQEKTKEFLHSYLEIATVLAHIIAGRKLRWKRDTLLSQSMRIGPASSGKGSGMKLAGIDKSESLREDREVADVVRLWRAQAGRLRTVLSGAGSTKAVPEISEPLPVRLAQQSEGAVSAPKPCALCALKRNERIPKIDIDVQDNFGEFWTEHWGHTICMAFWYSYEQKLASR